MSQINSFPLTALCLRFHCMAETRIQLGGLRAGSNLRGALVNVMRRATCAGSPSDAEHLSVCPVCWLVAANDRPGQERRGYVITPPLTPSLPPPSEEHGQGRGENMEPGKTFDFHITLFGEAVHYLPYFVLAVPETGRGGVGPGRGRFALKSIHAEYPSAEDHAVLKAGENIVYPPQRKITHADIQETSKKFFEGLESNQPRIRFDFLTPLRLIVDEHLLKSPDFGAFFNHLLRRVDELASQHAGSAERPMEERQRLWSLADRVRLVESGTSWVDVSSGSSRTGQQTWISGLMGSAHYSAPKEVWNELLPWLFWGEFVQVGKDTSKGNGVYRLAVD